MVSGSISLPSTGFFSPFPHGTSALSVAGQYLALDRGRPGFRQGSSCPALLRYRIMESAQLRVRDCHPLRSRYPAHSTAFWFYLSTGHPHAALQPRLMRFRLFRVRSPLLTESLLISFPGLLRWFTSPRSAPPRYFIHVRGARVSPRGLLHSDIRGSLDMCSSPRLFAACHVLHRLPAPRHPPWTYISLGHIVLPFIPYCSTLPSAPSQAALQISLAVHPYELLLRFLPSSFQRSLIYGD